VREVSAAGCRIELDVVEIFTASFRGPKGDFREQMVTPLALETENTSTRQEKAQPARKPVAIRTVGSLQTSAPC
jgi:hypothetical protein